MNKTAKYLKIVAKSGRFDYDSFMSKVDLFYTLERITADEYMELYEIINQNRENEDDVYE